MHGHVLVALLKAVVLSDVVEVVSADDDGPLHLHLGHHARQDPPSDGDVTSKRAFLVNVGALDGLLRCLEAQADVLVVSRELLLASFAKQDPLLILKDADYWFPLSVNNALYLSNFSSLCVFPPSLISTHTSGWLGRQC